MSYIIGLILQEEKRDYMNIAICDDEQYWQEHIHAIVTAFFKQKGIPCHIDIFSKGEDIVENNRFDMIFMDMEMTGMTGLETARRIRKTNDESAIVFLTSHDEIIKQTFEVKAYRFIEKKDYKEEVVRCLSSYISENAEKESIEVESKEGSFRIKLKEIMWIESDHNGSIVWGSQSDIASSTFLSEWEERLDGNIFFRCHKKYIVNLRWIESIDENIRLTNGYQLELSRRKKKELKQLYMEYSFRNM